MATSLKTIAKKEYEWFEESFYVTSMLGLKHFNLEKYLAWKKRDIINKLKDGDDSLNKKDLINALNFFFNGYRGSYPIRDIVKTNQVLNKPFIKVCNLMESFSDDVKNIKINQLLRDEICDNPITSYVPFIFLEKDLNKLMAFYTSQPEIKKQNKDIIIPVKQISPKKKSLTKSNRKRTYPTNNKKHTKKNKKKRPNEDKIVTECDFLKVQPDFSLSEKYKRKLFSDGVMKHLLVRLVDLRTILGEEIDLSNPTKFSVHYSRVTGRETSFRHDQTIKGVFHQNKSSDSKESNFRELNYRSACSSVLTKLPNSLSNYNNNEVDFEVIKIDGIKSSDVKAPDMNAILCKELVQDFQTKDTWRLSQYVRAHGQLLDQEVKITKEVKGVIGQHFDKYCN